MRSFKNLVNVIISLVFIIINQIIFAQATSFRIDSKTNIAYNLSDSSLYTGYYKQFYENKNKKSQGSYTNGIIKYCLNWDKKGNLLDSIIYLEAYEKIRIIDFSDKKIKSITNCYLSKTVNDTIYEKTDFVEFYSNGNKKMEVIMLFDSKNRYSIKNFYKNGNIKDSGFSYDKQSKFENWSTVIMDSLYIEYSSDGTIKNKILYKDGEQQNTKEKVKMKFVEF